MKKIIALICAAAALFTAGCAGSADTDGTGTAEPYTAAPESTDGQTAEPETTVPETEPEPVYPEYYVDFSDEENIYACSNLYNVETEYTGDGMRVKFLQSSGREKYCFDPYMTLPLPEGRFSVDDYPYFVISLYTSKDDLKGDIRYKTDGLKNGESYPTYRFSYGGTGERRIVLDLQKMTSVLFVAPEDSPTTGNYTNLRIDMFENDCSTDDTFVIYWYAFFRTKRQADEFTAMPGRQGGEDTVKDLSAYYRGDAFSAPDASYKPKKVLYGFDGSYDFTIRKLQNNGYGGIVTNVKFNQDYLKDDSEFELLKTAYIRAKEYGMHLWIYDEYQWPSGKAFGQVLEGHDEFEATGIELIKLNGRGNIEYELPDNYIRIEGADLISDGHTPLETDGRRIYVQHDGAYTVYVYARRVTNQRKEDPTDFTTLRDVDLLNPAAVARFIETTYVKYRDKLGDAFGSVEAFFTDEPQLGNRDMKDFAVWSAGLPEKFSEMHGYDVTKELYSLFAGGSDHDRLVRVNYYQTVAEMFREAYFVQIAEWCEKNGTLSSGHMLFEENIQRQIETYGGDFMQLVGAMGIPGADILQVEPDRLMQKGTDIGSFMGLKYVSSAAKNAGKTKVHLEFNPPAVSGAPFFSDPGKYIIGGATLSTFFGANTYSVICGDELIPVKDLQKFSSYVGRMNVLLDGAVSDTHIAVFYPVDSVRAAFTATGTHFDYTGTGEPEKINRLMQDTCYDILKAGLDFTVLDVQSIEQSTVSDGMMNVGLGSYSVIVMPFARVISLGALEKLTQFEKAGGTVIWLDSLPRMCDDRRDAEAFDALLESCGAKKFNGDLIKRLRELCPSPMDVEVTGGVLASGYINREDGTELLFLANTANTKKAVSFGKEGEAYLIYDPLDCTVTEVSGRCELSLEGYRAAMVVRPVGSGSVMQK